MGPENIVLLSIMVPKLKLKTTSIEILEEKLLRDEDVHVLY